MSALSACSCCSPLSSSMTACVKAPLPMVMSAASCPKWNSSMPEQPLKAPSPISLTFVRSMSPVRFSHPLKASLPMVSTVSGITTSVMSLLSLVKPSPISLTTASLTVSGMTTVVCPSVSSTVVMVAVGCSPSSAGSFTSAVMVVPVSSSLMVTVLSSGAMSSLCVRYPGASIPPSMRA